MNTLIITNAGVNAFNNLVNNPNYILRIEKVKFSNLQQSSNTLPSQNDLIGTTAEGILLTHFYSKDSIEYLNIVAFLPRKAFPTPDYIVQSVGFFNQNNNMIAATNISPSGLLVGVIIKASINLTSLNVTKQHKKRIRFKELYHISFDRIVMNQMAGVSDNSCPFENYMYHFFEMFPNGDHISRGVYVREGNNKYRIMVNQDNLIVGERI